MEFTARVRVTADVSFVADVPESLPPPDYQQVRAAEQALTDFNEQGWRVHEGDGEKVAAERARLQADIVEARSRAIDQRAAQEKRLVEVQEARVAAARAAETDVANRLRAALGEHGDVVGVLVEEVRES